jgi:hypothetical protein
MGKFASPLVLTGNGSCPISPWLETFSACAGLFADMIGVVGHPLEDITELQRVQFVI